MNNYNKSCLGLNLILSEIWRIKCIKTLFVLPNSKDSPCINAQPLSPSGDFKVVQLTCIPGI